MIIPRRETLYTEVRRRVRGCRKKKKNDNLILPAACAGTRKNIVFIKIQRVIAAYRASPSCNFSSLKLNKGLQVDERVYAMNVFTQKKKKPYVADNDDETRFRSFNVDRVKF